MKKLVLTGLALLFACAAFSQNAQDTIFRYQKKRVATQRKKLEQLQHDIKWGQFAQSCLLKDLDSLECLQERIDDSIHAVIRTLKMYDDSLSLLAELDNRTSNSDVMIAQFEKEKAEKDSILFHREYELLAKHEEIECRIIEVTQLYYSFQRSTDELGKQIFDLYTPFERTEVPPGTTMFLTLAISKVSEPVRIEISF